MRPFFLEFLTYCNLHVISNYYKLFIPLACIPTVAVIDSAVMASIDKACIHGVNLAALLQSTVTCDRTCDGILFGRFRRRTTHNLQDGQGKDYAEMFYGSVMALE